MADHSIIADLHTCEMLEELLDQGFVLVLSKHSSEHGGKQGSKRLVEYHGTAGSGKDQRRRQMTTLEGCIEELTSFPRRKICRREGCQSKGEPISIHLFGADSDARDGHSGVCYHCESRRIGAHNKKKKQEKSNGANDADKLRKDAG